MPRHMRFDDQDKRALRALDADFEISRRDRHGHGEMEVAAVRLRDG